MRYQPGVAITLPESEGQFVSRLAGTKVGFESFAQMVAAISDTIFYIERNAHPKTQLHALAIRLQHHIQDKPLPVI